MQYLTEKIFFFLCLGLLITSCGKENIDETIVEDPGFVPENIVVNNLISALSNDSPDGMSLDCVTINFPFDLALESGSNVTITSKLDYDNALNATAPNRVKDFSFPLTITENSGTTTQIENNATLGNKFGSCVPTIGWEGLTANTETIPAFLFENNCCFSIVYPVNLVDGDGNTYVANDEIELVDLCATIDPLFFSLPMTVVLLDESEVVFNTSQDFLDALFDCEGIVPPVVGDNLEVTGFVCNTIIFPFNVETPEGVVTVNDENDYADLILSGTEMVLEYPFSLLSPDGEVIVINDFDDVIASFADCGVIIEINPVAPCSLPAHVQLFFNGENIFTVFACPFDINYPVEVVVEGVPATITDVNSYFSITGAPNSINPTELVYPVTVTNQDGTEVVLNSDEEVCGFIEGC